ncbi:conserved hypothetical protein. Homolog to OMM_8 of MMP, 130004 of BW-1 and DMR_40930 of RS-1 [Desulfamplus magnetovallimortis]|uniref:Uncharacterized protein n=1 Tax=Desulfamplus magnetovallimortis TaxID=1246637 RepID=L0R4A8_9BACT|nr:hypothetical protein [Desulfamplus magnetovallimortis]CCO06719.1 conserved hypothetical protein. Homolog to OMM_8 of MMP, 130004 of BW-1 and DMR_40930 of RS-1 [Desulfamplus magnetovallimortis BW-1]SLM32770.1 conserved hypothetical protein. Homolog to OMM_8 of MMP, 130004 of BW-1 and DMR_40930 of RS-1 [Desulfamplus magnetovallimortis]
MAEDLRYNLQHLGDVIFDKVACASEKVKGSTRGISLTYKIGELQKEKEKLIKWIGRRVVVIRNAGKPETEFSTDKKLTAFFNRLDEIQKQIDDSLKERKGRLYPDQEKKSSKK